MEDLIEELALTLNKVIQLPNIYRGSVAKILTGTNTEVRRKLIQTGKHALALSLLIYDAVAVHRFEFSH